MSAYQEAENIPATKASYWRALREWSTRPIGSDVERAIFVLLFAVLVAVRLPRILLEGRFWAEEGGIFFQRAWDLPWHDALFLPDVGYLNLVANVAGVLARHLAPLWAAPYASTGLALLIQCVPAILIVSSRADWLQRRLVVLIALLLIASPSNSQEVWLNSITSQFHLALAAGIILALEARTGPVGILQFLVLLVAPLSGPASWALAPLFALRATIERSRLRALQTLILLAGLGVQIACFFTPSDGRHIGISPTLFGAAILAKHFINPYFYSSWASILIDNFSPSFGESGGPIWPLLLAASLSTVALGAAALYPSKSPLWFLCSGMAIAALSYAGALGSKAFLVSSVVADGRYAFAPQVLFALALLSWGVVHPGSARMWARGAVAWILAIGLLEYFPTKNWVVQKGPPWRAEVQKRQQDSNHALQIWPPGWSMTLRPRANR